MSDPAAPFAGTSREPIPDGGILVVHLCDPARPGQSVPVTASDGADPTDSVELAIALRGNGKGQAPLVVPVGWTSVVLRTGDATFEVPVAVPP